MKFVSLSFMLFVIAVAIVYFAMPKKYRWTVLLAGSYVFYWINSSWLLGVLLAETFVTFYIAKAIQKSNDISASYLAENKGSMSSEERKAYKAKSTQKKKRILTVGIIVDLGTLVFLKYANFFIKNTNSVLHLFKSKSDIPTLHLMLPLGISFFTLQAIAYMTDVYRGKFEADRNVFKFALFMSFFPQIVQGPIARHDQLSAQLYEGHSFDFERMKLGFQLILWGFMKKLILADRIGVFADEIFNNYANYKGIILFAGAVAYGLQVYADFTAGMDIARGVSQIFGIEIELNFKQPYFATSIEDFWRRWHITLGAWMRDYIFYPLSLSKSFGNLGKRSRKIFGTYVGKKMPSFLAMFIVCFLVGFWHGAEWKYIIYGIWNGIIITSGILLVDVYAKTRSKLKIKDSSIAWRAFQILRTFILCSIGRIFSRAVGCKAAFVMIKNTFDKFTVEGLKEDVLATGLTVKDIWVLLAILLVVLVVDILHEKGIEIRKTVAGWPLIIRWVVYMAAIFATVILGMYGPGYDASSFIYQQF